MTLEVTLDNVGVDIRSPLRSTAISKGGIQTFLVGFCLVNFLTATISDQTQSTGIHSDGKPLCLYQLTYFTNLHNMRAINDWMT